MTVTADDAEVIRLERDILRAALGVIRDDAAHGQSVTPVDAPGAPALLPIYAQATRSLGDDANGAAGSALDAIRARRE